MDEKEELIKYCQDIDKRIKQEGEKTGYCEARYKAAKMLINAGEKEEGFRQTLLAKNELHKIVKRMTKEISYDGRGLNLFELDDYCRAREVETNENKLFWDLIQLEAQDKFDSYLLYLEKDREVQDRFYLPKRECFRRIGVVQALQDLEDDELDILSISLPPGTGKSLRTSAKVLTPTGFIRMGDIKVGDKVIAGNGNITTVSGVFPQGVIPCYRVYFDDGSFTEASGDHLWKVQTREDRLGRTKVKEGGYRVVTTDEMRKHLKVEYSIDYVPRIEFAEKSFTIHPYVLGVLLGDGDLSQESIQLTTPDVEILDKVNELLPRGYSFVHSSRYNYLLKGKTACERANIRRDRNIVKMCLTTQGLHGTKSDTKFIPKDYLYASYEQRLWLLRGLLDTDGTADKGNIEYSTASKQLCEDVRELVHSLGGYCSYTIKKAGYKNSEGNYIGCKDCYRMTIQFSSEQPKPFYLTRKAERYNPKRSEMKRFVTDIEYIGEEECQCIYVADDCHLFITDDYIITHNTTLEKFFCTWVMGRYPNDFNLFFSHSDDITRMFYDGVLDIIKNFQEYNYKDIFPRVHIHSTNAKAEKINLNSYKPFDSLQCTTSGSSNAGKVRANHYLLCDDLVPGIEIALNRASLDKLWRVYSTDAKQRKTTRTVIEDGVRKDLKCKEIHIATRWSVYDVIGRLQLTYKNSDRARFIAVPDIDPNTGKSNFDYEYNGMSVEFFNDQALTMDDITYRCLYKNDPIEREGILYHADELRRFDTVDIPQREPDGIYCFIDVKNKGTDFMVAPVLLQYGNDFYCTDCVCDDNADFGIQEQKIASLLYRNKVQQAEFESNNGGDRFAFNVEEKLNSMGGFTNITSKFTETNKETRILVNADWVKRHILFKNEKDYNIKDDYGVMVSWLCRYSIAGKNVHDDVPDCFANAALHFTNEIKKGTVEAVMNPLRSH